MRESAVTDACVESTPEPVVSVPPNWADSLAICSDDRVAVPSSIIAAVKLARPGFPAGLVPLPDFSTSSADTTGRPARSFSSTVSPLASVNDVGTGSASARDAAGVGGVSRHGASALIPSPFFATPVGTSPFGTSGASVFSPGTPCTTTRLVVVSVCAKVFADAGVTTA